MSVWFVSEWVFPQLFINPRRIWNQLFVAFVTNERMEPETVYVLTMRFTSWAPPAQTAADVTEPHIGKYLPWWGAYESDGGAWLARQSQTLQLHSTFYCRDKHMEESKTTGVGS